MTCRKALQELAKRAAQQPHDVSCKLRLEEAMRFMAGVDEVRGLLALYCVLAAQRCCQGRMSGGFVEFAFCHLGDKKLKALADGWGWIWHEVEFGGKRYLTLLSPEQACDDSDRASQMAVYG